MPLESGEHILDGEETHSIASLCGGATAVRSKHDVRNIEEIRMDVGLSLEHVEPGGENLAVAQSSSESFLVNDRSREVFTRTAVGFIIEKAASPIR